MIDERYAAVRTVPLQDHMNRFAAIMHKENTSVKMPLIGLKVQGVAYATIFLLAVIFSALHIPTGTIFFEILIVILIAIPAIGFLGLYAAVRHIRNHGSTKMTTRGLIFNVLYLAGNAIVYVFIYFLAKYGVSV
jgi:hypothetical protein